MSVLSGDSVYISIELILYIAGFLQQPEDIVQLMRAVNGLLAVKGEKGETILHVIARDGYEELMKLILARGVVSGTWSDDITPLYRAATCGQKSVAKLLTCSRLNVNKLDHDEANPLHWAAKQGHDLIVKMLLERVDIKPNLYDGGGRTPMSWAAENGHKSVVDDNVNPDSKDHCYDRTPLSFAAEQGHLSVVELLLQQNDVEADTCDNENNSAGRWIPDYGGRTPLSFAAGNGRLAVVSLLMQREDVDTHYGDYFGRTPLSFAAERGQLAVVELLLQQENVSADFKNKNGHTPLSFGAKGGHLAVVELLLQQEEFLADFKDKKGRTPL